MKLRIDFRNPIFSSLVISPGSSLLIVIGGTSTTTGDITGGMIVPISGTVSSVPRCGTDDGGFHLSSSAAVTGNDVPNSLSISGAILLYLIGYIEIFDENVSQRQIQ